MIDTVSNASSVPAVLRSPDTQLHVAGSADT
jgi:hypothetical protein